MLKNVQKNLWTAAARGDVSKIRHCLDRGADINAKQEEFDQSALDHACFHGRTEAVRLLIMRGARINLQRNDGTTALFIASQKGNVECTRLLLRSKEAIVDLATKTGLTPLIMASQNGHLKCVKLLVRNKAKVNQSNNILGVTPLDAASMNGHTEIVKYLIDNGASVNVQRKDGATALFVAAEKGHLECVKFLIANNAQVNLSMNDGNTPLLVSSEKGHIECSKYLILSDAQVNLANNKGLTPLHMAAMSGQLKSVQLLIENRADSDLLTHDGKKAIDLAREQNHQEIVDFLNACSFKSNQIGSQCNVSCQEIHSEGYKTLSTNSSQLTVHTLLNQSNDQLDEIGFSHCGYRRQSRECILSQYTYEVNTSREFYKLSVNEIRGICLIISNESFKTDNHFFTSSTTAADRIKLESTFSKLKYRVILKLDCSANEMKEAVHEVSQLNHTSFDSLVICVLSHEINEDICDVDGLTQTLQDLITPVKSANCPSLEGKPKLIFIRLFTTRSDDHSTSIDTHDPCLRDFFFCHIFATAINASSSSSALFHKDDEASASQFIDYLCNSMELLGRKENLSYIIDRVTRSLAAVKATNQPLDNENNSIIDSLPAQIIHYISHLTKLFKF